MASDQVDAETHHDLLHRLQQYHVPAFAAGATLIIFLVVLNQGIRDSIGLAVVGQEIVSPIRISLIGLGTGYYLGDAIRNNHTSVVAFHIGAFLSLLGTAVLSIRVGPIAVLLALAVVFALSMNASKLVERHEQIREAFDFLARDGTRGGLVAVVIIQYTLSLAIWADVQLSSLTIVDKGVVIVIGVAVVAASITAAQAITRGMNEATGASKSGTAD